MTLNEKPIEYIYERNRFIVEMVDSKESDEFKCYFTNAMFSECKSGLKMFLYWLLCVIGGTGEYGVFGVPYDLKLVILLKNNSNEDIVVTSNKYSASLPFSLEKVNCIVKENKYITVNGYAKKWFIGKIIPIFFINNK
ncbi:hypothetical protein C8E03_103117 [Lachnotalea glycerini]|nr:hypothetical protein C8E03_103117 [Lachnotalea glycerini]